MSSVRLQRRLNEADDTEQQIAVNFDALLCGHHSHRAVLMSTSILPGRMLGWKASQSLILQAFNNSSLSVAVSRAGRYDSPMQLLAVLSSVGFLLFAAAANAGCPPTPGAEQVWSNTSLRWVFIGEMHGSNETPNAFSTLVCNVLAHRKRVTVIEIWQVQQEVAFSQRDKEKIQIRFDLKILLRKRTHDRRRQWIPNLIAYLFYQMIEEMIVGVSARQRHDAGRLKDIEISHQPAENAQLDGLAF
jgi:hypothetical protein